MHKITSLVSVLVALAQAAPPSSSSLQPKPKVTTVSGCPPITYTTSTSTVTIEKRTKPVVTSTYTTTSTVLRTVTSQYQPTYTTGSFDPIAETKYLSTTTVYDRPVTATSYTFPSASTTVTVPAPSSFTPVLCEHFYYDKTITSTQTNTLSDALTTSVYVADPTKTATETETKVTYSRTTTTLPVLTVYRVPSETVTSTIRRATRTKYLACASPLNVTPKNPFGGVNNYVAANYDSQTGSGITNVSAVPARDATDCCEQCFAMGNCTGSAFDERKVFPQACQLFRSTDGTCDQRNLVGQQAGRNAQSDVPQVFDISNGPCGQYGFDVPR